MTGKKKIILIVAIVIVVLAAAGVLIWRLQGGTSKDGGVYVQPVTDVNAATTATANRYSGIIETQKTEDVAFDTSKKLSELLVAEGDRVAKGDPLFTYDTQETQLQIEQAQLEIERMNTTISNNNAQITQLEKDMKAAASADKPGFSAQILQLQADIAQNEYNIKTKQAEIDKLNAAITNATVCAGMDGTVESIADLDTLLAGGLTNPDGSTSNTYISILADGDYRVKGTVTEQNIYELSQGAAVIVRSRVDENQTWTGTISSIDTQAESNNNNMMSSSGESASKYAFYVNLDNIDGLMLGQHVTIEMDYGQGTAKEGIWLGSGWITQEEDGSAYVWAAKSGGAKLEKRAVELGEYDSNMDEYQIVSGLSTTDYLAWPDVDCVPGANTTTEFVIDDTQTPGDGTMDEGMTDGDAMMDGGMTDGTTSGGAVLDDGTVSGEAVLDDGTVSATDDAASSSSAVEPRSDSTAAAAEPMG